MPKVTSKLQIRVPKALADHFGIKPGDEIELLAAGDAIRVVPAPKGTATDTAERRRLFDGATERQGRRERGGASPTAPAGDRGWTREEILKRGSPR